MPIEDLLDAGAFTALLENCIFLVCDPRKKSMSRNRPMVIFVVKRIRIAGDS